MAKDSVEEEEEEVKRRKVQLFAGGKGWSRRREYYPDSICMHACLML
jgi:hypothetical protein